MKNLKQLDQEIAELQEERNHLRKQRERALADIRELILAHHITLDDLRPILKSCRGNRRGSRAGAPILNAIDESFPYLA